MGVDESRYGTYQQAAHDEDGGGGAEEARIQTKRENAEPESNEEADQGPHHPTAHRIVAVSRMSQPRGRVCRCVQLTSLLASDHRFSFDPNHKPPRVG